MAFATKYQWTIAGRTRTWTVALQQEGFVSGDGVFTTLYAAIQNSAVGATENYVAKVTRDESNVGSWSYSLVGISHSTYGSGFVGSGTLWVDEADDIMFIRFSTNNVWAFRLDGTPIVHVWTPDGTNDVVGATIDPVNNRFYLMMRNDTGGTGRTSVLREYTYDGTYVGAAWSNLWGTFTTTSHLAYEDGYVYFLQAQGTTRILYRIDLEAGTHEELGGSHTTSDGNQGYGAVDVTGGKYFANYIGSNEIRSLDLPTPGSVSTVEATTAGTDTGLDVDRVAQKIYWTDAQRSIARSNYDGSGDEGVIDFPSSGAGTNIFGISLGNPQVAPTTLIGGRTARIVWGETTGDLDSRIMPADVRLEVRDPGYVLYNELSAADIEEEDYQLVISDSEGEYTLRMRVRLDTVGTAVFPNLNVPITTLYGYCGLSELKNMDAVTLSSSSLHNTVRYLLVSSTTPQNIEYVTGVYPENVHTSGAILDLVRLNRMDLLFEEEGRKRDNAETQLRGILEALDAAMWNGFDGQWHVKHRFALGEYITGRGAQRYKHVSSSLLALPTLQLPFLSASARTMSRDARRRTEAPLQAVEIEQGPAVDNRFTTVNLVKYGDFEEGWVSTTEHLVWSGASSVVLQSTDSDAGTYAMQINAVSPATVRQDLGYFSANQPIRFQITGRFGHELTSGGSGGSVSSKVRLVLDPYDAAASPYYATASGWTTTPTDYNLTDTANPFGSGVSYQDIDIETPDSLPAHDGLVYIEFTGDVTGNWVVRLDGIEVRVVDEGYEPVQQYKAVFARLTNNLNPATRGAVVRQRRAWFPGTLWVDTDNNTIRDLEVPMIQADTDGAGDWQNAGYWTSEIEGDVSQYDDLARWSAESRIEQQAAQLEVIDAEILDIVPPERAVVYSGGIYAPVYCDIDLAREVTRLTMVRKQRAYTSLEPPDPFSVMYVALQNNAVGATDNYVAKVVRDEDNVGSWSYSLLNISQATYGTALKNTGAIHVDEGDGIIFVMMGSDTLYSFALDGTPIEQVWSPGVGDDFITWAIDSVNNKIYILVRNDTGGTGRTSIIYEYDYDGTNEREVWSNTYGSITSNLMMAYDDGSLYFVETVGASTDSVVRVVVATGAKSTVLGSLTLTTGGGQGAAHAGYFWFGYHISETDLYKTAIPTGATYATHDGAVDINSTGVAVDRVAFRVYWTDAQRSIVRSAYDGSGEVNVIDFPATGAGTYIYGISLGR